MSEWPFVGEAARRLFVTSGVAAAYIPMRFRASPQIAVITLKPATDVATIAN